MGTQVEVLSLPKCDFCLATAKYDGRTNLGMWANMCETHFRQMGVGLGTGKGQKLILKSSSKSNVHKVKKKLNLNEPWTMSGEELEESGFV